MKTLRDAGIGLLALVFCLTVGAYLILSSPLEAVIWNDLSTNWKLFYVPGNLFWGWSAVQGLACLGKDFLKDTSHV